MIGSNPSGIIKHEGTLETAQTPAHRRFFAALACPGFGGGIVCPQEACGVSDPLVYPVVGCAPEVGTGSKVN